tara:strand:+ start:3990 stop:4493 length:504 start_codon:yes stop_codon:yes gene_type:complete
LIHYHIAAAQSPSDDLAGGSLKPLSDGVLVWSCAMRKADPESQTKEPIMKNGIILAAAFALSTAPAFAQATQPAPEPQAQTQGQAQQPAVKTVSIIDITELPEKARAQVAEIEEQRSEEELMKLRESIKTSPALLQALEQKGTSAAEVVAARLSRDGNLTIVTRKEG